MTHVKDILDIILSIISIPEPYSSVLECISIASPLLSLWRKLVKSQSKDEDKVNEDLNGLEGGS